MQNKKYFPSLGFIILSVTIISVAMFLYWVENAVFDATQAENKAHIYFADKEYSKAHSSFYKAATLSENNKDKSRQYRCAANAAHAQNDMDETLDMIALSLKYDKTNKNAIALLKAMLKIKQITKEDIDKLGVDY